MILALLIVPTLAGLAAFVLRSPKARRGLLTATALVHATLTGACWRTAPAPALHGWLALDAAGLLFLTITSALFLAVSIYGVGYLNREAGQHTTDAEEGFLFDNAPEAVFVGCLLLFLAAMTLVTISQHFGLQWVGIEATTIASAPLIYFHRHHRSLEATWKYLLICSVGIALALLANFFLGVAATAAGSSACPLTLTDLVAHASELQPAWLQAAFILFLVGYGTKMGLAPLHTWLPDAHSEAPSVISALLSGALLNCAFLGLVRVQQVCVAAGRGAFVQDMFVALGLVSLAVAAVFILGQADYKRLLAYSSVEHMGLLALGVGLGGCGVAGAMLHAVNHSFTKAMLFLTAGNLLAIFRTKSVAQVRGVSRVTPLNGALWLAGFVAITGLPPFGLFISKFIILKAAFATGHLWTGVVALAMLVVIFMGLAQVFLGMAFGIPDASAPQQHAGRAWETGPPLALGSVVLLLGLILPQPLVELIEQIASSLGGAW